MGYEQYKQHLDTRYPRISDLATKARKRIPKVAWEYLATGTGDESLLLKNRQAFEDIQFSPRFCKGPLQANTTTRLFGQEYQAPIGMAPVGLTGLMWPKVEQYLAATANVWSCPIV